MKPTDNSILYLGIDGGGSKCRARLISPTEDILGVGTAGPANALLDLEQTINSVVKATQLAIADAGLEPEAINRTIAGVGLAGVNVPSSYRAIEEWQHPFRQMYLTTDLHIACLGAHGGQDGAVMITGTGSCGFSSVHGNSVTFGGHGFTIGDHGSGGWMGLEAIKAVMLASDGLGPRTSLVESISTELEACGIDIVQRMAHVTPNHFAKLAPLVFDAANDGDEVATAIVRTGANYIESLAEKLWHSSPPRMSLLGGLRHRMTSWLDKKITDTLSPPLNQPEVGAIHLAQQMWANQETKVSPVELAET